MRKTFTFLLLILLVRSSNEELTQIEVLRFYSRLYDSGFKPNHAILKNETSSIKAFYVLKEQRKHYDELLDEIDILFPLENFPEQERTEADQKYRAFVQSHPNEAFLPIIRNRYSKFMLVNFRLLETDNYEQIKYYTNELIGAKSDKHELLIESLKRLKGNIAIDDFNQLKKNTITMLKEQQESEANQLIKFRKKIDELVARYKKTGKKPTRFFVDELERQIRKLEENTIACMIEEVETI
ncbi:hypothetical protein [Emticicia sp. C21]|uniref:hypothetical protein n=1 Tax=Emticicia sp. C21 TaxID=2302915 RepID=UPI000E356B39|nr:hypothetical protein [Emticicia sp. C21]RFS15234.1 hypothetical protein D0T08_17045 [Emticicia sp. C21]